MAMLFFRFPPHGDPPFWQVAFAVLGNPSQNDWNRTYCRKSNSTAAARQLTVFAAVAEGKWSSWRSGNQSCADVPLLWPKLSLSVFHCRLRAKACAANGFLDWKWAKSILGFQESKPENITVKLRALRMGNRCRKFEI